MGYRQNARIIYLVACFCIAAFFIHFKSQPKNPVRKESLNHVLTDISGWKRIDDVLLEKDVVESLDLDDYVFRRYRNGNDLISLYIGYYRTAGKIGAAHSPLVCFPGQGWEISTPGKVTLASSAGALNIEKLIVKQGTRRELLLYWFQSYDMTSRGTFHQKINNFWARMKANPEDNAFVRVSIPIDGDNSDDAYQKAADFILKFYPKFHAYLVSAKEP